MSEEERDAPSRSWKAAIAAHPIIFGVIISCISIGAVLAILITAPRIIG